MRLLLAPYPFKGTLTSAEAARAIGDGVRDVSDDDCAIDLLPLGDGGAGTLDALIAALGGERRLIECDDPLGRRRTARWGLTHDRLAVIEAAEGIGLALVPKADRDPSRLRTDGLGEVLLAALAATPRGVIIGLGDTATHDCGLGLASRLGYRFLDREGRPLTPIGASLPELHAIDPTNAVTLPAIDFTVYCDVLNPLLGSDGAARRFASQKGAGPDVVELLERGGERFARVVERDLGLNVADIPGAGAAGGLGAGLAAFCRARLAGGADGVLDAIAFDRRAASCAMVVTGEGRLDRKTMLGKGVANVAERARRAGVGLMVIAGGIEGEREEWERRLGAIVVALDEEPDHREIDAATALRRAASRGYEAARERGIIPPVAGR